MAKKPVNIAPTAGNDRLAATEDAKLVISAAQLLSNDADANGDLLSLLSVGKSDNCSVSLDSDGNVVFKADKDFSGQASFTYVVSDGNGGKATATVYVDIAAVADGPRLKLSDAQGKEDGEIKLHVDAALTDKDGSESLKLFVSGVPQGASLSAGIRHGDGSWELTREQLDDLRVTPVANSDADFTLTVRAVSTEASNGSTAESVDTLHVKVNAQADLPVLVVSSAVGVVDTPIALDIRAALTDTDGSEHLLIKIGGVPEHATLSAGTRGANGVWSLTADQLDHLSLIPSPGSDRDFDLRVRAIAIEDSNGDRARVVQTLHVTVNAGTPVNHAPVAADDSASATEDQGIVQGNVLANDRDPDAHDSMTVAAPGTYTGAYGSLALAADGSYTYTAANLDALAAGQTVHDSFSYQAKDPQGATSGNATLTLSITGTNDAAVLSAATVMLAEADAPLITGGVLTISDVDSPAVFVAQAASAGAYGSFSIDASGAWSYTANSAFDALNEHDSVADTFLVSAADGTTTSVQVTISGTNDAAVLSSAAATLDETDAPLSTAGTLTVSDVDSPAAFIAQTDTAGAYGSFSIGANGNWTYAADSALNELNVGDAATDTFAVSAVDGTTTSVQVTTNGTNDAAVLSSAAVVLTETNVPLATGGKLAIADVDSPTQFVAQTDTAGTHGSFSIDAGGNWSYAANSAFNELNVGDAVTDIFAVSAADGTLTSVQVSIAGTNDDPVAPDHSAATFEDAPLQLSTASLLAGVTDADLGDRLTLTSVGGATNGAVSLSDGLVSFIPGANFNGSASFTYTVTDGSGATDTATVAVTVVPVNDAPSGSDKTVTTTGTAPYSFAAADFGFSDPSDGDHLLGVRIASLPGAGILSNGGVTVVAGQVVLAADIAAGMLRFTPSTGALGNGYASFTFQVQDSGGHANGGSDLDATPNVLTVNVAAAHDLFDGTVNNVDFDQVVAGGYVAGTQYNALGGDDSVLLPSSTAEAAEAGFVPGTLFLGGAGNDTITGRGLNDNIDGGAGNDTLSGGAGVDTLSYASATAAVSVDLSVATAQDTHGGGIDVISGFENLIGTAFADTLFGDAGDNIIDGGAGSDLISGGAGNDDLRGGAGTDQVYYGFATSGVTVSLALTTAQNTGGAGIDILSGFEILIGSPFDDLLAGDAGDNTIIGGAGNDTVTYAAAAAGVSVTLSAGQNTGGAGTDLINSIENLIGSSFNDVLIGDTGNNVIEGGPGNDLLAGRAGTDTLSYASAAAGVTVSLAVTVAQVTGGAGTDMVAEFENLTGSSFDDLLAGDAGNNVIVGGAGVDTLTYVGAAAGVSVTLGIASAQNTGGAGTDTIAGIENLTGSNFADVLGGDAGNNVLVGGAGRDTLTYAAAAAGVTVDISLTIAQDTRGAGIDTLAGFENLTGSAFDDRLSGDAGDNTISAGAGIDTLSYERATAGVTVSLALTTPQSTGGAGVDTLSGFENLVGSSFNDVLAGDAGNNVILGGAGLDTLTYAAAAAGVGVTLGIASAQNTGWAGIDTISEIENLIGSSFNDVLTGDAGDNVIEGGLGDDILFGNAGSDTLSFAGATSGVTVSLASGTAQNPGSGTDVFSGFENLTGSAFNDVLAGDAGNNIIDGGGGQDTLSYAAATAGVDVHMSGGGYGQVSGQGTDIFSGIENVTGSPFRDFIYADSGSNVIDGGGGTDVLSYEEGSTTAGVTVNLGIVGPQNTGGSGVDSISGIENLNGSAFNDVLIGDSGDNLILGRDGDDVIEGGPGNDVMYGEGGINTLSYASATSGVTVSLLDGTGVMMTPENTGGAGSDLFYNFANLSGSAFDDVLSSDDEHANVIDGGAGNDLIHGDRFGDLSVWGDTYIGGSGTDTLSFATAADAVRIDYSTDPAHPELNDVRAVIVIAASSVLTGTDRYGNPYYVTIPAHLDEAVIAAHSGFEAFVGSNYDDDFRGDGGTWAGATFTSNLIIFEGGLGNDWIMGGFGNYVASYASAPGPVTVDVSGNLDLQPQDTGSAGLDTLARIDGLIGSAFDDVLLGAHAYVDGGAGDDRIQGNFQHVAGYSEFDTVLFNGGPGVDTFVATQDLDLSSWQGDHMASFEVIDLSSAGSQKLTLGAADLLDLSDTDQLIVRGNADDSVDIDLANWTHSQTDVTVAGVQYESYNAGLANLLVQSDLQVV